jgi:hypothetical protein
MHQLVRMGQMREKIFINLHPPSPSSLKAKKPTTYDHTHSEGFGALG